MKQRNVEVCPANASDNNFRRWTSSSNVCSSNCLSLTILIHFGFKFSTANCMPSVFIPKRINKIGHSI